MVWLLLRCIMNGPDARELRKLFADADQDAIIGQLAPGVDALPSLIYQNWVRLMEAESFAAQVDPVHYVQEVVLIPDVLTEFVPLFLAREDPAPFLDTHFIDCTECGATHFTGFHLSPTLPYHPASRDQLNTWINGEKRFPYDGHCPECGTTLTTKLPPAVPPAAWLGWWYDLGLAKVLHEPLKEKIEASRRFQPEEIEENIMDATVAEAFDVPEETDYHIPLIVQDYQIGDVAIDAVRSIGGTEDDVPLNARGDDIRETMEQFNVVCERRGIEEKIFIVLGTIPKSIRTDLVDLKRWFYSQITRENSKYRGMELHIIAYPEELDLILNQRLYGRAGPEDEPQGAPKLYDLNAWEMEVADISFGSEELDPSEREISFAPSSLGTPFEFAVRELLEAEGYQVYTSDELDHNKVDLLCQRSEGNTEHFHLVQCKYSSIDEAELSRIDDHFDDVKDHIRNYWDLFTTTEIDRVIAVESVDPELEDELSDRGYDVITLADLRDNRDDIQPNLRDMLGI